jgi:deoxyribonuclease-4
MNLFGVHLSIGGGYHRAVEKGTALGVNAIQIFTKNQLRWEPKQLTTEERARYLASRSEHPEIRIVFAHGSYLYNFSSPDGTLVARSKKNLVNELMLCDVLSLPYLVVHPGSHMGAGESRGIDRVVRNLRDVIHGDDGCTALCIETTAGQGDSIGYRFEHLRDMIGGMGERACACVDTCHIFAAGYDIRFSDGCDAVIEEFDRIVGLRFLKVIHLNDSRGGLGSRIDRHAHIGKGEIGTDCFRFFMRDPRFTVIPKVIETPKKLRDRDMDGENIRVLRELMI